MARLALYEAMEDYASKHVQYPCEAYVDDLAQLGDNEDEEKLAIQAGRATKDLVTTLVQDGYDISENRYTSPTQVQWPGSCKTR